MSATKGGFTFSFHNYNTAQENNVSKGISGPAPLPATPLLSEKNNFTRCTLPSEIIELVNDEVRDPRVPHQHAPPGRLHQTPLVNQHNTGFTSHLAPTLTGQRAVRINQPDVSSLNSDMLPQMGSYQPEPLPGQTNQSGLVSHTGSPSLSELLAIGRSSSEIGVSNLMMTPQTGPYRAMQQHISNNSHTHFSTYSMPQNTRQLDCTSIPLDSDLSSFNFGMLPQRGPLLTEQDFRYPSVTTSSQIGSFQLENSEYGRTQPDMGFPGSEMPHPTGSLLSEHPNGSTNGLCMGSSNMVMTQLRNSAHIEHQKCSTTESGTGTSFRNLVSMQPQVNSYQNSALLTTPNTKQSSTSDIPRQESELEGRPYQEMVPTEEVATNQVTTENQGIDLNKTPQQKPRRRKYVPKVVTQGKKPRATKKTTPKKASEDRPKRKYVRKKGVEPPPMETPVNANGADKPVENSNSFTQNVANLDINLMANSPSHTSNAANWINKTDDLPASSTLNAETVEDKPIEASHSCTSNAVNGHDKLVEVSMPCTPSVTTGLNKPIDISSSCTNMVMQISAHRTVSGMSGPPKSVRRRLNFDAQEVRPDGYKHPQSQPNLNPVSAPPAGRNVSTLPIITSSVQVDPSPSKGIALDLNSTASQWQEECDRLFPPASSTSRGGTNQVPGTNQTPGRTMRNTNLMPTELGNLTGYPYPPLPHQTNNVVPTRSVNHYQMGIYNENLAALAKKNDNLVSESILKACIAPSNSYSNTPSLIPVGRKRDHSALVSNAGLTGQVGAQLSPRIIETSKKTRIWNGNNTGQNGTKSNAPMLCNSSSTLPPVRPDSRVFSLADAQRLVELQKRNNTKMLSFRIPEGNTEKAPIVLSEPDFTSTATTSVNLPQSVNGTSRDQIYQPGISFQTSAERTTAVLNQFVNTSDTQPYRPITPVISGVNRVTLEMLTGSRNMNAMSTQLVDHIIRPHATNGTARNESCQIGVATQTISETTTEKPVPDICPQPSMPAKSPTLNTPSKSEPKRRGRRPKSEKAGAAPLVPPRPKGRPPGKKSSLSSTNLMVGGPAALVYTLDLIIQKMSRLDINRISGTVPGQPCYALVPYQSGVKDGRMVLYDDGMVKKKRKSRAQVDLDPVTSQVWNLLMGKEMKDGLETVNENDEKMMEAEREVFRGRVDSFIARMHLVQGDRRFSPWKGSVVDSVVGVFLTQNVSDHLSSSAFMSLAAKYPVKTHLQNLQARESTLIVNRPHNMNPYARDFINLTKWHRQREVIIEDFTDIGSQVTSEEKDSNESQDSTTKGPGSSPEKKSTGSPDSGPGLVINFSSDDPASESVVSSQNSVVSNQSSLDYQFQTGEQNLTGLGLFGNYSADGHVGNASLPAPDFAGTRPTSYTQLLRMAESNGVGFSPDLNKETGAVVDLCSSSDISQFHPQNGVIYAGTSSTLNNSNTSCMSLQNGVYPPPAVPAMVDGNKMIETSQIHDSELRIRTHSTIASQTPEPITPMIKITTTSGKTHGNILVQEENKIYQVESNQPPVQQSQPQAQNIPSACNSQNAANGNNNNNTKASSETVQGKQPNMAQKAMDGTVIEDGVSSRGKKGKGASGKGKKNFDWDSLRTAVRPDGVKKERTYKTMDSLDYEALKNASVSELSDTIRERGMNNMLAERIKGFLDRVVNDHGSIDLEWLRDVDPDKAKDYLLSIRGLGLKSVECVRLLTLHHMAFPVDTNVGRICVRLGWVPLQPLPESLQLHLLEMYPILENIQKYLWPRLCKFDQRTLYELHYQMITFGKVFCTKSKPNCNACPMRAECKHFASAFASARLALPAPEGRDLIAAVLLAGASASTNLHSPFPPHVPPPQIEGSSTSSSSLPVPFPYPTPVNLPFPNQPQPWVSNPTVTPTQTHTCNEPIIEEPASPEPEPEPVAEKEINAIEDAFLEEDPEEIPVIKLDFKEFTQNLKNYIQVNNLGIEETSMSKAMVAISPEAASIPVPKLKNISRLRTEHQVYELPDNHILLKGFEPREPDDPCPYLLSIWTPGETAMSTEPPKSLCISQDVDELCDKEACARCASIKEARSKIVRGTILIPCRTAMRGSFPLNGTYFQVNEVFADHETSRTPVDISRAWIWNLPRRTVYFGTSIPTIFKGQSTEEIQHCFWRGFVCVRGFDRATRAPRPLYARLHFPASKVTKNGRRSAAAKDEE